MNSTASLVLLLAGVLSSTAAFARSELPEPVVLREGWQLQHVGLAPDPGEAISRSDYVPQGWFKATVPGTILTSLVNIGMYPEPLYGENNRTNTIPDTLCRTSFWYRTTFTPPASYAGKRVWLTFKGINYIGEVWVNGAQVGKIEGAFARGIFDVSTNVSVGQPNGLAVHLFPEPHPGVSHEKTIADGTGRNGGVTGLDGPTFLCSIGWDWIPTIRDRDTGIWQDVVLSASGPVVLPDPAITSDLPLPRTDSADLTVQATVRNATDSAQTGILEGKIEDISFKQEVSLAPHEMRAVIFSPTNTPALRVKNPRLWWPNGYGRQELYRLHLSFSVGGALSDERDVSFGIRKMTYALPGSDNLALSVNGVPVIAKGGDWGMDEAMKRNPRWRLDAMIRMHQIANYTMIRNWVGQSTSDDLYDLCDQYGILLWDEFFEPHPADGPVPENIPLYLANVREKILRYRNHACIALWCARNEGDPPPAIGDGIQKLIQELDPTRLYQPSSTSGRGVNSGGPYRWRTPREYYAYNEAFKTEIGSMSVPTLEAVQAMMPAKDWGVVNDDWAEHDFCAGAQAGDRYPEIISSRYGFPGSLADFVRKAQLANYEAFRAMYEGRFAKLFHPETGVITWMSSPAQPSFVWQLYSHDLEPNSALYGARKACEPIHVQMNQDNWHVMVINNTPETLKGLKVTTSVYNLDGSRQYQHTGPVPPTHNGTVTAAPSAATDAGPIPFPDNLSAVHFVKLELAAARGRLLSENFYWRALPGDEDNFTALNRLPMVGLDVDAKRHDEAGTCKLDVQVKNPSRDIALMAHFQLRQALSGKRVLPVFYSDNYLCLLPGESRSFTAEAAVADLGGEVPMLAVDGWNVTVMPRNGTGVSVGPNTAAQVRNDAALGQQPATLARINCGGGQVGLFRFGQPGSEQFARDRDFQGGKTNSTDQAIEANVPNAAPQEVYQSERWGACTYSIPAPAAPAFTVRLHFAEARFGPGERKFNVDINGAHVLKDFDIAAEAGKDKALVEDFPSIKADAKGNIVIKLSRGSADEPKICGIEVIR